MSTPQDRRRWQRKYDQSPKGRATQKRARAKRWITNTAQVAENLASYIELLELKGNTWRPEVAFLTVKHESDQA